MAAPSTDRPRHTRRAARVIIVAADSVLLLGDTDPGVPGSRWWVTPGGGIDHGEDARAAAVRELTEEVGLVIAASKLIGPVAVREVIHGYSDRILQQHEQFFLLRLAAPFDPAPAGLTPSELLRLDGWAWLPLAELDNQTHPVWPANLLELATTQTDGELPRHLGFMEESTVPVE